MRTRLLLSLLFLATAPLLAQAPHEEWRTIETPHFRFHYPAPYEAWTRRAAGRMEAIRDRVIAEVGYEPEETVDVIVMDPIANANGSAWPFLGWPRMVLWTSPPGAESAIGANRDWIELLTVHEETHLIHILRPSRNPLRRLAETTLLPLGPIGFTPRWVTEGYATMVEGELTGSGRPFGDFRATILRRWAQEGRLPNYSQLGSDSQSWLGMSQAYLTGSAFLEWLQARSGPGSLRNLWRRTTARSGRSFEAAFTGVFGDKPPVLYGRFTAELTQKAMNVEDAVIPSLREGELWQDLSWTTEVPVVSPDGSELVTVLRGRRKPSRLVVWSTAPDEEAEEKYRKRIETMLKKDPEDVAPVRSRPLSRKPEHSLETRNGAEPFSPRWTRDGKSILFVRFEPDADGFLHADLYRWTPSNGDVDRITRLGNVRDADPSPDGRTAIAVRNRFGFSQLVRVDMITGAVAAVTDPTLDAVYASPRVSHDGKSIACVKQSGGRWHLMIRDEAGAERELRTPDDAIVAQPAWSGDGRRLFAAIGTGGFIEIYEFATDGSSSRQVTRSRGASIGAAPSPDDKALFFLGVHPDGLDLRRLDLAAATAELPPLSIDARFAPAIRMTPVRLAATFPAGEVPPGEPYGVGRLEPSYILGGNSAPSNDNVEAGIRLGDVVGRLDGMIVGAAGSRGSERGGAIAGAWRGWPVTVQAQLFRSEHDLSLQPKSVPGLAGAFDTTRSGAELRASWRRHWRARRLTVNAGALLESVDPRDGPAYDANSLFAGFAYDAAPSIGKLRLPYGVSWQYGRGDSDEESWDRRRGHVSAGVGFGPNGLRLSYDRDTVGGASRATDKLLLGGLPGSILPESAAANRILVPALPVGTAFGDEHEGQRAEVRTGAVPFTLFAERHRVWIGDQSSDWLRLAGLEMTFGTNPMPLLKMPGLELRLGAARVFDEPFRGDTTWWIGAAWRP